MKKNAYSYILFIVILLISGGCNDNINLTPEGIITADNYFTSQDDYENALNAVYSRINYGNYDLC